ncbi:transposable element Tcb2 transposase [Trichonephila clavipes]|nr:transposable element Tcb2 transposase [Trichonephila clavipes]
MKFMPLRITSRSLLPKNSQDAHSLQRKCRIRSKNYGRAKNSAIILSYKEQWNFATTVQKCLLNACPYAKRSVVCVLTCHRQKCDPLFWANEHVSWTKQQWTYVLFTEEFRLTLKSDSVCLPIWSEQLTRYNQSSTVKRHNCRCGGIMRVYELFHQLSLTALVAASGESDGSFAASVDEFSGCAFCGKMVPRQIRRLPVS